MRKLLFILLPALLVISSCSKNNVVDISSLEGRWYVANYDPNLAVDSSVEYVFNSDNTYTISVYNFTGMDDDPSISSGTYVISLDNKLITLYEEDGALSGQYDIINLHSGKMTWQTLTYDQYTGEKSQIHFEKAE